MLLHDSIPTNITRVPRVTMVNKLHIASFDLVDGLDNNHWSVKVFALHCIAAPRDDPIDNVVVSKDQTNQHNLNVERDGEQGEELHDKL